MTIAHVMERRDQQIVSCSVDETVGEGAKLLAEKRIGAMPVLENGTVAGIFSERDLLYCIAREGQASLERSLGEVMTAPAITVEPQTSITDALSLMTHRRIRHLPVVQHGALVAFVSIGDLVKYRLDAVEAEARHMREYIATA